MSAPGKVATVDALLEAGALTPLDLHFARTVGRLGGDDDDLVLLGAAVASRRTGRGHVCVDLPGIAREDIVDDDGNVLESLRWPPLARWMDALRASPVVGSPDEGCPLVLDEGRRLYLRRYWEYQERLASMIRQRVDWSDASLDEGLLEDGLSRLFPGGGIPEAREPGWIDWQRVACLQALRRRLCVISGGPGTGKTYTVAKILALVAEQALARGAAAPRVALLAPTGKAAARLKGTIASFFDPGDGGRELDVKPGVREAIPRDASTIHRCLRPVRGSSTRFRHDASNPLATDVVIVDEASMVDLSLMTRLLDAIPASAKLILLGDRDQLASVEAGAILGDICNADAGLGPSTDVVRDIARVAGQTLPPRTRPKTTGIWDCVVQLEHSYRYGDATAIASLARAIRRGDAAASLDLLESEEHPSITLLDQGGGEAFVRAAVGGYRGCLETIDPRSALVAFESFRVLCPLRRGPQGVEATNPVIEHALRQAGLLGARSRWYRGRPVLVTSNDYQLQLFNGDAGLVLPSPEHDGGLRAFFLSSAGHEDGAPLPSIAPSRLPSHETAFAMSVHKSQGSEFDEVVVLMPGRYTPLLTRELLYTAVSRARKKVTLFGSREIVERAVEARIDRASGLREELWKW
ncbi:MAG: exodeoxyribonuclease V subunit alpha [Deltaproteobacteria bacterium]|nr:exodeoxyribonuclease V subunit alpha [Deltaproteobacteria bacterium]